MEASPALREIQKQLLCGDDAPIEETEIGHKSISKHIGVPVIWVEDIRLLPHRKSCCILSSLLKNIMSRS